MKKIFIYLFIVSSFLISCDKELLEPFTPGSLTEDIAITKSGDLVSLQNSALNILANRTEYVFTSIFTDEAAPGFNNGGQGITSDYIFLMNPSNPSANNIWQVQYFALARINRVITFADKITPKDAADAQLIARTKAEALVLRALCHIKIISYYSTDPKNNSALAGILSDRIIETSETPSRVTNGEFYTLIHSDLDAAIAAFDVNTATPYSPAIKTFFPSKVLAQALKARAYALKGDYPNAEIFADAVINTSGITLATTESQYNSVFHTHDQAADTEVIFRLRRTVQQNTQAANLHNGWVSVGNRRNGSPFYEVSRGLFNALAPNFDPQVTVDDPTVTAVQFANFNNPAQVPDYRARTNVYFSNSFFTSSIADINYATNPAVRDSDILVPQKHGGQAAVTATNGFNPNFMVSRLSEMHLIKAEARAFASDFSGVAGALQSIVTARFVTPVTVATPISAQAAWKAILDERRKELSFEGFRYIDLKRLGTLAGAGLDRHPAEYASSSWNFPAGNPANLPVTSFKFTLPIPVGELSGNPGITQNPGY